MASSRRAHGPPLLYPLPPLGHEDDDGDEDVGGFPRGGFSSGEHVRLADSIKLRDTTGAIKLGVNWKFFTIRDPDGETNGIALSYGEISALAGDFYSTYTPICSEEAEEKREELFDKAWTTLEMDNPRNVQRILELMEKDIQTVRKAVAKGEPGSKAYGRHQCVAEIDWQNATKERQNRNLPTYVGLAALNLDHFGDDAYTVYCTIHKKALDVAAKGNLTRGYAINAFADHFLQDLFSAGHIRTPRRYLHGPASSYPKNRSLDALAERAFESAWPFWRLWEPGRLMSLDAISKFMHDEESYFGLAVKDNKNPPNMWNCYGDTHLLDPENEKNLRLCRDAVQNSADEVYKAYKAWKDKSHKTSEEEPYNLKSARPVVLPAQALQPLVRVVDGKCHMRNPWYVKKSQSVSLLSSSPMTRVVEMKASGQFDYPMDKQVPWWILVLSGVRGEW